MVETLTVLVISAVMIFAEAVPLIKNGQKRSGIIYFVILAGCLTVILLINFGIQLPTVYYYYKLIFGKFN